MLTSLAREKALNEAMFHASKCESFVATLLGLISLVSWKAIPRVPGQSSRVGFEFFHYHRAASYPTMKAFCKLIFLMSLLTSPSQKSRFVDENVESRERQSRK